MCLKHLQHALENTWNNWNICLQHRLPEQYLLATQYLQHASKAPATCARNTWNIRIIDLQHRFFRATSPSTWVNGVLSARRARWRCVELAGNADLSHVELAANAELGSVQKTTPHESRGARRRRAEGGWGAATTHRTGGGSEARMTNGMSICSDARAISLLQKEWNDHNALLSLSSRFFFFLISSAIHASSQPPAPSSLRLLGGCMLVHPNDPRVLTVVLAPLHLTTSLSSSPTEPVHRHTSPRGDWGVNLTSMHAGPDPLWE
jgi:hypothetical protein